MALEQFFPESDRIVAGVMSGTSVDGVDVVVARLEGTGVEMKIDVLGHAHEPYEPVLRDAILANSVAAGTSTRVISQLNAALPLVYAEAVQKAMADAHLPLDKLNLVGSHGQTIHHVPTPDAIGSLNIRSTLQIGDPAVLAAILEIPVVGDFRTSDMALGGEGAPLVPYFDYIRFRSEHESRVLLNLGGIANATFLPRGCKLDDVVAFDTGPANMVVDQLAQRLFGLPYDPAGSLAGKSTANVDVLTWLLQDEYYGQAPPKSTGRERFGSSFVEALCLHFSKILGVEDDWTDDEKSMVLATATALTAHSVAASLDTFKTSVDAAPGPVDSIARVIVAGGGTMNQTLMSMLASCAAPAIVEPIDNYGIRSSDKEALCFAVLAHELLNGTPTGMPSVTGASRPAMQGKICLPSLAQTR